MIKALERQEASEGEAIDDDDDQLASLQDSKIIPTAFPESLDANGLGFGMKRVVTEDTLVESNMGGSPESTPSMSSEDASEVASTLPITPKHKRQLAPLSTGSARPWGSNGKDRDLNTFSPNPIPSRNREDGYPQKPTRSRRHPSSGGESTAARREKPQNVDELVADAMETLTLIRQKEQAARPLRIVRQDPQHVPDQALKRRFQELVDDELKIRRLNARDWLRVATWWLLKVRMMPDFLGHGNT